MVHRDGNLQEHLADSGGSKIAVREALMKHEFPRLKGRGLSSTPGACNNGDSDAGSGSAARADDGASGSEVFLEGRYEWLLILTWLVL